MRDPFLLVACRHALYGPWHCPLAGCTADATGGLGWGGLVRGSSTVLLTERRPWKLLVDPLVCFRHYGGSKINHEWTVLSWRHGGSLQGALCDVTLSQTCCSPRAEMVGDTEEALKCHNEHWALCFRHGPQNCASTTPPAPPAHIIERPGFHHPDPQKEVT